MRKSKRGRSSPRVNRVGNERVGGLRTFVGIVLATSRTMDVCHTGYLATGAFMSAVGYLGTGTLLHASLSVLLTAMLVVWTGDALRGALMSIEALNAGVTRRQMKRRKLQKGQRRPAGAIRRPKKTVRGRKVGKTNK